MAYLCFTRPEPQLGNLSYWGITQRARTGIISRILYLHVWHQGGVPQPELRLVCRPELLPESSPHGLGFLKLWWPEDSQTSSIMSLDYKSKFSVEQGRRYMTSWLSLENLSHFYHYLLVKEITNPLRYKGRGAHPAIRWLSKNL